MYLEGNRQSYIDFTQWHIKWQLFFPGYPVISRCYGTALAPVYLFNRPIIMTAYVVEG
jgi:hypothetical protein